MSFFFITDNVLTFGALAVEGIDLVNAFSIVKTRLAGTLICVDVAEHTLISCQFERC